MSTSVDRSYAARCLLMLAALERDAGAAGYAEGMAERVMTSEHDIDAAYVERIERHVEAKLPEVAGVEVDRDTIRVTFADGSRGALVCAPDRSMVSDVAAALAGVSAS